MSNRRLRTLGFDAVVLQKLHKNNFHTCRVSEMLIFNCSDCEGQPTSVLSDFDLTQFSLVYSVRGSENVKWKCSLFSRSLRCMCNYTFCIDLVPVAFSCCHVHVWNWFSVFCQQ